MNLEDKVKKLTFEKAPNGKLSCSDAFDIADKTGASLAFIGDFADKNDIRLCKCRLGLFGWEPIKKILSPEKNIDLNLKNEIIKALDDNNKLSCKKAYDISEKSNIPLLKISNTCETLDIKICDCQLGAF